MDFHEILLCEYLLIYVEKIQVWSEHNKNNTVYIETYINIDNISLNFYWGEKKFR